MTTTQIPTVIQMADFVSGSEPLEMVCPNQTEAYNYIQQVAVAVAYQTLPRKDKGCVRAYLGKVTGYSPATLSRLLGQFKARGNITRAVRTQPAFHRVYTDEDITELARIDKLFEHLNGAATVETLRREYVVFGNQACVRLQHLSVAHLYNLRGSKTYKRQGFVYHKTKPTAVRIGARRKPQPDGRPGYVRVDTVHQGDKDGEKGVYHINLVDEVTQWEIVVCVEGISERFMIPALETALERFPFVILGFHADNGSEYVNQRVADLLERLRTKLTKSRPRHSGDNGLVETKNGAIIRKALGYLHIPRTPDNVIAINSWYQSWFIGYLNFHRPCAFRAVEISDRGKRKYRYPKDGYKTPYDKLKSLTKAEQYLKPGASFELLDLQAYAMSDSGWAEHMQEAKAALWESLQL